MNILVTGGAGFIGSHLSEALIRAGNKVVVLDNLDAFYDPRIKQRNLDLCQEFDGDDYAFVEGSINDMDLLEELFDEHDITFVFHEAARAGVRRSVEDPQVYERNNVGGLLTLLEVASDHDIDRFVNASSSSVYGPPEHLPLDERHPTAPKSPYAVTKLAAEHFCRVWNDLYELPTVNLRYFTVYGPRMRPNMAITNFTSRCLNGDSPVIYGDGEQTRDFTYIDDVIRANLALIETDAADGETMNIGSTDHVTINELARHVIDETGADVEPVYESPRAGDVRHTRADVSKAARLLDYEPTIDIREGVSMFIDWYRANRDWYEPLVLNS